MNAQLAYEHAEEASYQDGLDADDRFDRMVEALREIPAFVREALDHAPPGCASYYDRLVESITEGGYGANLIDDALNDFAQAQMSTTLRLANALKTEAQIVNEWRAHQRSIEALTGRPS